MDTPTPDNAARAAAWVSETSLRTLERDGEDSMWVTKEHREIESCTVPLYSAATVTALEAEVDDMRMEVCRHIGLRRDAEKRADAAERRLSEVREIQRAHYGDGVGLHLAMIRWARDYDTLTGAGAK